MTTKNISKSVCKLDLMGRWNTQRTEYKTHICRCCLIYELSIMETSEIEKREGTSMRWGRFMSFWKSFGILCPAVSLVQSLFLSRTLSSSLLDKHFVQSFQSRYIASPIPPDSCLSSLPPSSCQRTWQERNIRWSKYRTIVRFVYNGRDCSTCSVIQTDRKKKIKSMMTI
jgi:hypothetical protein